VVKNANIMAKNAKLNRDLGDKNRPGRLVPGLVVWFIWIRSI